MVDCREHPRAGQNQILELGGQKAYVVVKKSSNLVEPNRSTCTVTLHYNESMRKKKKAPRPGIEPGSST